MDTDTDERFDLQVESKGRPPAPSNVDCSMFVGANDYDELTELFKGAAIAVQRERKKIEDDCKSRNATEDERTLYYNLGEKSKFIRRMRENLIAAQDEAREAARELAQQVVVPSD